MTDHVVSVGDDFLLPAILQAAQDARARTLVAAAAFPTTAITYSGGNVATVTENGVLTTYAYNVDGTVRTDTRAGITRTYSYDGSGNLTGIA